MSLRIRPVAEEDAREFASWTYPEPYAMYSSSPEDAVWFLDPANGYLTVEDDEHGLVGFCCFGLDARVPGGTYDEEHIDLGTGMRPELTGQGRGREFLGAVIDDCARRFPGKPMRTTVAAFNERARRMVQRAGFRETEIFVSPQAREFVVYVRD
jgi:[ribosomal protein S18]-alanine N-acetyltransferase